MSDLKVFEMCWGVKKYQRSRQTWYVGFQLRFSQTHKLAIIPIYFHFLLYLYNMNFVNLKLHTETQEQPNAS